MKTQRGINKYKSAVVPGTSWCEDFAYRAVPRSGSSWMEAMIAAHLKTLNLEDETIMGLRERKPEIVITLVRNPFARALSGYFSRVRGLKEDHGFKQFLIVRSKEPDGLCNGHYQTQSSFLERDGKCFVDKIFKLEELSSLESFFSSRKIAYSPIPINTTSHRPYAEYYTKELSNLVVDRYKRDFELLEYEKRN